MNKIYLMVAALFCSVTTKSQTITADCTDLSGDCYYYTKENIIVTNSQKTKGFTFSPAIRMNENKLECYGIFVNMINMGRCNEDNEMIILLADSSTIMLKSSYKFNCKSNTFFYLTAYEMRELRLQKILKVQLTNGYTFDSFQKSVPTNKQDYFFRFFKEIDANIYTVKK